MGTTYVTLTGHWSDLRQGKGKVEMHNHITNTVETVVYGQVRELYGSGNQSFRPPLSHKHKR